jgi:cytoskeletal protein CcmA (bactofilin family)
VAGGIIFKKTENIKRSSFMKTLSSTLLLSKLFGNSESKGESAETPTNQLTTGNLTMSGTLPVSDDKYTDLITTVGEGTTLQGDIEVSGQLFIKGSFQGKIRCDKEVYICESGVAMGEILATDVRIAGKFEGQLECGELNIEATGVMTGDAAADTFVIASGGQFHGNSSRRHTDNVTQLSRASQVSKA